MQLNVKDGLGQPQVIIAPGIESALDWSGGIVADNTSQVLLAANADRAGWLMQNVGANPMVVNDLGAPAATPPVAGAGTPPQPGSGSFVVQPGQFFPPYGFPLSTAQISILGSAGDAFVCREWSTPSDQS